VKESPSSSVSASRAGAAAAVGGAPRAGPVEGGGWRVRVVLPLAREEDA